MGGAFDASASYQAFLVKLSAVTLASASLMLFLPRYGAGKHFEMTSSQCDPETAITTQ